MAKIRHIAIASKDADKTKKFYTEIFGMEVVQKLDSPKYYGYLLTDGYINMAILDFKDASAAGSEWGVDFSGLHHMGFQIDESEGIPEKLEAAGYEPRVDINQALGIKQDVASSRRHEFKYSAPVGVVIDLSSTGWAATSPSKAD